MVLSRLTKITGPGVATDTNWVGNNADFTGITTTATSFNIGVTTIHSNLIEAHNIKSTGIITATGGSFSGNVTAVDGTFTGNVSIAGTLTYEDVTNIDSVGIITAPALDVDDFLDIGSSIKLGNAGVITATSFVGSGAALTGIDATAIKDSGGNVKVQAQASGAIHSGVSTFQDIDVDGHTNLDNVSIAGITTHSGSTTFDSNITFNGSTSNANWIKSGNKFRLNDNSKVNFGGGDNLQVYHTGTAGYITNNAGAINITGTDGVTIGAGISAVGVITATSFVGSGAALTGIDATAIKDSSGNVKIQAQASGAVYTGIHTFGTNTNFTDIDVDGHTNLDNVSIAGVVTATSFVGSGANLTSLPAQITFNNASADRILTSNGGTAVNGEANLTMTGNNLQFNTTANGHAVILKSTGNYYNKLSFDSGNTSAGGELAYIDFKWDGTKVADIQVLAGSDTTNKDDGHLVFRTSPSQGSISERLRITSDGNVGINQVPTRELSLHSPNNNNALIHFTNDDTGETASDGILVGLNGNEDMIISNQESGRNIIGYTFESGDAQREKFRISHDGAVRLYSYKGNNNDTPGITFRGGSTTQSANFALIHSRMTSNWGGQLQFKVKNDNGSLSDAYQTAMIMNQDATVTKPLQPRALVKINSTTTLSNAKMTNWASPIFNVGSLWNAANSRFIAPVDGLYMIGGNFRIGAPGKIRVVRFNIQAYNTSNGHMATYGGGFGGTHNYDGGSGGYDHPYVSFTNVIYLTTGQYLELHCSETSTEYTSYIQVSNEQSHMWCVLLQ